MPDDDYTHSDSYAPSSVDEETRDAQEECEENERDNE